MSETVTRKLTVTFNDGLPLGTHANFKVDRELWIAIPAKKYQRIVSVTDRLIGALSSIRGQMTRWVAAHPNDADRTLMLLATIARAENYASTAAVDKVKAQTA